MDTGKTIALIKALGGNGGGTGGGVLVVHKSVDNVEGYTLDKTWQEIYDADFPIIVTEDTDWKGYEQIISVFSQDGQTYAVAAFDVTYSTTSADGYPKGEAPK